MLSRRWIILGLAALLFVFSGCVNPMNAASNTASEQLIPTDSNPPSNAHLIPAPGDAVEYCISDDAEANADCFEDAFSTCRRAVGNFWTTSDDTPLSFESVGLTADGKCTVRVTVLSDDKKETPFAGKSATCLIEKSAATGEHTSAFFDSYSIGPSTCTGSYVDSIHTTPPVSTETTTQTPPSDSTKEFSITVNEHGVDGEDTFTVQKGDSVTLNITVDLKDVSFNGEQILAPAVKGLSANEYIFDSGHLKPGQLKSFTFVADQSFDFGIYWPGPSVLKGKGHVVVEGN